MPTAEVQAGRKSGLRPFHNGCTTVRLKPTLGFQLLARLKV